MTAERQFRCWRIPRQLKSFGGAKVGTSVTQSHKSGDWLVVLSRDLLQLLSAKSFGLGCLEQANHSGIASKRLICECIDLCNQRQILACCTAYRSFVKAAASRLVKSDRASDLTLYVGMTIVGDDVVMFRSAVVLSSAANAETVTAESLVLSHIRS